MSQKRLSKSVLVSRLSSFRRSRKLDSLKLLYLFVVILLIGAIFSAVITKDTRWMDWHFSRLGEGGNFSSLVFNITLFISAMVMFILALSLRDNISLITSNVNININRAKMIVYRSLSIVTLCLIGVAVFPFDRFPVIHNICGYSMLFIILALCIYVPNLLPIFSKKFYIYSRLVILCVIICYILFIVLSVISLLTVEFIIFLCLFGWFLLFIKGIRECIYCYK